jgi:hypothetical protein
MWRPSRGRDAGLARIQGAGDGAHVRAGEGDVMISHSAHSRRLHAAPIGRHERQPSTATSAPEAPWLGNGWQERFVGQRDRVEGRGLGSLALAAGCVDAFDAHLPEPGDGRRSWGLALYIPDEQESPG